jgi:hypothetical protein
VFVTFSYFHPSFIVVCKAKDLPLEWTRLPLPVRVKVTDSAKHSSLLQYGINNSDKDLQHRLEAGNTKGGSITVPLTSCLAGLESAVWQLTIFVFICKTD